MAAMKSSFGRQDQKEDRKIQLEQATLRSAKLLQLIAVDGGKTILFTTLISQKCTVRM